jgi:hypothetical protein
VESETSSVEPHALYAYSDVGLQIDAEIEASAARLAAVLAEFAATCREYPLGIDARLADPLRDLARRKREHDLWVRRVAEQFEAADSASAPGTFLDGVRGWVSGGIDRVGDALPTLLLPTLDPNGPISRAAQGEAVNPLDWSHELADYESQSVLAGAPDDVRNAQFTVTLPGAGTQTISVEAFVALALDPANLIGGPEDSAGVDVLERALPYLSGATRSAVERLLGRAARDAPAELESGLTTAVDALTARATPEEVQAWADGLPRVDTPQTTPNGLYEVAQTGPYNYTVPALGETISADGIRASDARLLEAKYVGSPDRSPFIDGSSCPDGLRTTILAKVDDEFRRYAFALNDPGNPVKEMEVIVNDERAVPYFSRLLDKYGINGQVVVRR